jgi:hypothetical protein
MPTKVSHHGSVVSGAQSGDYYAFLAMLVEYLISDGAYGYVIRLVTVQW